MVFNQDLRNHVPPAQLDRDYGGEVEFTYDHAVYWPAMNRMCTERRETMRERWERGGKRVGEFEAYLRGGEGAQRCLKDCGGDVGGSGG